MSTEKSKVKTQKAKLPPPATFAGALTVAPVADVAPLFAKARELAGQAIHHAASGRHYAILAGLELYRLHEQLGVTRGGAIKDPQPVGIDWPQPVASLAGRNWREIVLQEVGISDQTAARWMNNATKALAELGVVSRQYLNPPPEALEKLPELIEERERAETAIRKKVAQKREAARRAAKDTPKAKSRIDQFVAMYEALTVHELNWFMDNKFDDLSKRLKAAAKRRNQQ
ncbi:MAG: hypothetical protein LBK76_08730 [Verrucomicrobiales bacterium]|nr:hypothetical protein [Verrucomicrobiales bacterium]